LEKILLKDVAGPGDLPRHPSLGDVTADLAPEALSVRLGFLTKHSGFVFQKGSNDISI